MFFSTRGHAHYTDAQGRVTDVGQNDIVYLPRGSRYTVDLIGDNSTETIRMIRINFTLEDSNHEPFVLSPDVVCLWHDIMGEFKTSFQDIRNTYCSTQNKLAVTSLFLGLLNKLTARDSEPDLSMERCGDFIRENVMQELTVPGLASRYQVSVTTFRKRFKEIYGVTPVKYINDRKMETACELLHSGDISIEEIVRLLGYYDTSYFYKRMKADCGLTPGEYRRSHRARGPR